MGVLNPSVHHAVVLTKSLSCGIDACVFRDGTFLFDFFSGLSLRRSKYRGTENQVCGCLTCATRDHAQAADKAETYALLRAQIMNVHQLCLGASERIVKSRSASMGFPVTSWNTLKGINFDTQPYDDDVENLRALARNTMNNKARACQAVLPRRVIDVEVVDHSLLLLDNILVARDPRLIQFTETFFLASCSNRENRLGEALMLTWATCEQMLSLMWNNRLNEVKSDSNSEPRMSKARREKLKGRDYPISVVIEILELEDRIPNRLYRLLDISRKGRNYWMHELRVPGPQEVLSCLFAAQSLLHGAMGIALPFEAGGRGGVPQWNVWISDSMGRREIKGS